MFAVFWFSSTLRPKQFLCNLIRNSQSTLIFFGAVHQSYAAWAVGKSHPHRYRRLRCHLTHSFCAVGGRGNGGNHRNHTVVTLLSGLLTALFFSYANSDSDFSNQMSHFICDLLFYKVNQRAKRSLPLYSSSPLGQHNQLQEALTTLSLLLLLLFLLSLSHFDPNVAPSGGFKNKH